MLHSANLHVQGSPFRFGRENEHVLVIVRILRGLRGAITRDKVARDRLSSVLLLLKRASNKLPYAGRKCVRSRQGMKLLYAACDVSATGQFETMKALGNIENFGWQHKTHSLKKYVHRCQVGQQKRDGRSRIPDNPASLHVPAPCWNYLGTDFTVKFPVRKRGCECIIISRSNCRSKLTFSRAKRLLRQ